jgi:hypothetical protein
MSFVSRYFLAGLVLATAVATGTPPDSPVPAAVEMRYCGLKVARPPLKYMSFDIKLHNSADKPQWFLFPASLYDKPVAERKGAGINGMDLLTDPQKQVMVVDFWGTMKLQPDGAGGFRGLFLPAGATVSVHNFRISFWGEPSSPLAIKVVLADEIKFMRNPIERTIGKKLLSANKADVKELRRVQSVPTPDMGEFPVDIKKSGEVMVPDAMAQKCAAQGP